MSKQKIYYKVVTNTRKSVSYAWSGLLQSLIVQYVLNEFVKTTNGTPLYVFDNLQAAQQFIPANDPYRCLIYPCVIKGKCKHIPLLDVWSHNLMEQLGVVIRNKKSISQFLNKNASAVMTQHSIPKGTVAVKQVKLLKNMEYLRNLNV